MTFFSTGHRESGKLFSPQMTLIISMNCPHCLQVISFLADNYPMDIDIRLAAIDSDKESLSAITFFLQQEKNAANPFQLLKKIKEDHLQKHISIRKGLRKQTTDGFNYIANLGITGIPVLVAELKHNEKKIFIGTDKIIPF